MGSWYEQEQQKFVDEMNQDLYDSVWNAKPLNIWEQLDNINLKEKTMSKKNEIFTLDEASLSRYISNKIYYAKPMTRGEYNENRGWTIAPNEDPHDGGYVILYPDGYISWSPAQQFEETAVRTDSMNFGMALAAIHKEHKVARRGWNGKDMFIYLQEGSSMPFQLARNPVLREYAESVKPGLEVPILPHIDMKTANGSILIGWQATQTDMLSNDWFIVD